MNAVWVSIGGALGSLARYGVATGAAAVWGTAFPFGTLIVNVVGSFLISVIMTVSLGSGVISPTARLFLTTGIMGGFTTYSSFNFDTLRLAQSNAYGLAGLNIAVTVVGCLAAGFAGVVLGRWLIAS